MDSRHQKLSFTLIFYFIYFVKNCVLPTFGNFHRSKLLTPEPLSYFATPQNEIPITYFQVTNPIILPKTVPYSYPIFQHTFASSYGKPPVITPYNPPSKSRFGTFAKIILEWKATCKGRQFDRIFGVWLGGVELLRSCTAEPIPSGIVWSVEKDITRYSSLLIKKNQTLAVYLGNVVDKTYTGLYHTNITVRFYPLERRRPIDSFANLILPISRSLPLKSGLWFEIESSSDLGFRAIEIPYNSYKAVLEVYVSFHENDEFWYQNFPNNYIAANNLTGIPGNGPFREVLVHLDDMVVGCVWPFTVVYTGGINPLFWRPITGIGSFDLPSYDIEITPFLGLLLDGNPHKFGFSVRNALNVWYIDANLHLWIDSKSAKTVGELVEQTRMLPFFSLSSDFRGLNGTFTTSVSRNLVVTGWINSSHGKIETKAAQDFSFSNSMMMGDNGDLQIVNQIIEYNDTVISSTPTSSFSYKSFKRFSFGLHSSDADKGNNVHLFIDNVTLEFQEARTEGDGSNLISSSLKNSQNGHGYILVDGNLVKSGLGSTQEVYEYESPIYNFFRNVSSCNYTILYDKLQHTRSPKLYGSLRPQAC